MSEPVRIQRKRTKDWRMPENTVYVGRGSIWGNPYKVGDYICKMVDGQFRGQEGGMTASDAAALYEHEIGLRLTGAPGLVEPLRGKNLACWCPLCAAHRNGKAFGIRCDHCAPCHSDVLGEIANA